MTGIIMFSIIETRPNIVFAIFLICFFAKNLNQPHSKIVKTIFQYLKNLKHPDITYKKKKELKIENYSNLN